VKQIQWNKGQNATHFERWLCQRPRRGEQVSYAELRINKAKQGCLSFGYFSLAKQRKVTTNKKAYFTTPFNINKNLITRL
jgi:hypothetical protein